MPANIVIPAAPGQYPSNLLVAAPYDWREPKNQDWQRISGSINWGGGEVSNGASVINFQGSISNFDKIRGMYVDNTQSAADVTIFFPDTQFEFTVNAGEKDFFQVVTNARQVVMVSTMSAATDKTFFQLFNFAPPPLASNKSLLMSVAASGGIALTTTATTAIVAAGTNGTIRALNITLDGVLGGAAAGGATIVLQDGAGTPHVIWSGEVFAQATGTTNSATLVDLAGINVRFTNGLNAVITVIPTAFASGKANFNIYFGTP